RSLDDLGDRAGSQAPRTWHEIQSVFEELYNGSAITKERYGLPTRVGVVRGLASEEAVLLRPKTVEALRQLGVIKLGIVTGRSDDDWRAVRDRIPLPPGLEVSTDAHGRKPEPLLLKRVLDNLGSKGFVHVGDTVDDVRMVQAYLPLKGSAVGHAVVCCEPEREAVFRALGVRHLLRDVNGLPAVLAALR
ncbi:MAG: HAD-IA family hydrolase, partial [Chloroflexi bacterium]|nr:HAD-IA family hydrolase [Chloroflexota bacterium]